MTAAGCRRPTSCPVPDPGELDLRRIHAVRLQDRQWYTVFDRKWQKELFNASGLGDARFSPLKEGGAAIPTLYAATTRTAALLETVFHEVTESGVPKISRTADLAGRGLRTLQLPRGVRVADFRDEQLTKLGVQRGHLIATSAMHYPCTRDWALRVRQAVRNPPIAGILWRSRLTEIASARSDLLDDMVQVSFTDVIVLFGDRIDVDDMEAWDEYSDLASTKAGGLLESVAAELGAVIL